MSTQLKKGDFVATVFGNRWYVAKVLKINERDDTPYKLSYMHPSRGKWKWTLTDIADTDASDILCRVMPPMSVSKSSKLMDLSAADRATVEQMYEVYKTNKETN